MTYFLMSYDDYKMHLNSGGDPEAIPNLTFDEFKHFHQKYYHPSNSRIFFYGDDPVRELKKQELYS
jgi:presequence protease